MLLSSYHPEIVRSYYHWQTQCPCKRPRSRSQRSKQISPQFGFSAPLLQFKFTDGYEMTIFSCDQARRPVCPSVTHFSQCSCHRIILKLSGVITIDKRNVHAKGQGQGHRGQNKFRPNLDFPHHYSSLNSRMATKWLFLAATKHVGPSVRLSHISHNALVIVSSWNCQELLPLTNAMSMQKAKVKVTEVKTNFAPIWVFRTITPV